MPAKHSSTLAMERTIVEHIRKGPASIAAICDSTGYKDYQVRRIVNDLVEHDVIRVQDTIDKHRIYIYNDDSLYEKDTIPRFVQMLTKQTTKSWFLIEGVGNEDRTKAVHAARNIYRHIVNMFMAANSAHHGADVQFILDNKRTEIQQDLLYLKNVVYLYEQLLKEPKFWNPRFLAEMPNDPDFDFVSLQEASDYYDRLEESD